RERNKNYAEQSEQKRDHIAGLDAKEHGAHQSTTTDGQGDASENGHSGDEEAFAQNHPEHLLALRADGHAHSDFRSAAADAIGERSVEAGGDKQRRDDGKKDRETGKKAGLRVGLVELSALSHWFLRGKIGIEVVQNGVDAGNESFGIAAGAQLDLHVGDRGVLRVGEVKSGLRFFVDPLVLAVANDPDDGEPLFSFSHRMAWRISSGEKAF